MSGFRSFLLGLFFLAIFSLLLVGSQYPAFFDNDQVDRLFEMNKCFQAGQIPCRWIPDVGNVYGYPLFNYYAPLPYYFGEFFYVLTNSLTFAARIMFTMMFLGTYFFGFILAKKVFGNKGAFIASIIYTLFSYFFVTYLIRGPIDELWAFMFIPVLLWSLLRLMESRGVVNLLIVSLSVFLLLISHNLGTFLLVPLFILSSIILWLSNKDPIFLKAAPLSLVLGLLLAAFYWLPMVTEREVDDWGDQIKYSIVDFTPLYQVVEDSKIPPRYEVLTGETKISDYQKNKSWISFTANSETHSIIRLSMYYFPAWKVMVDGKEVKIDYKNNSGLITFILGQGSHKVQANLEKTPIKILADFMSIIGLFMTVILLLTQFPKTRKWIFYYIHSFNK